VATLSIGVIVLNITCSVIALLSLILLKIKSAFYGACKSIFLYGSGVDEVALLHLQETYSLSVIMYAMPSLYLTNRQSNELNACWNNVIQRLFGYNKCESVSALLLDLGRLNVKHLIVLRKVKLYRNLLHSCNTVLSDVFFMILLKNFRNDFVMQTIIMSGVPLSCDT